jgi:hypothetical protein
LILLFALYPLISRNYFILCFIVCLGALQWAAARNHRPEINLLGPWGRGWAGLSSGAVLIIGGFTWFMVATPGLFQQGLAGGELFPLFSLGGFSALLVARLASLVWRKLYEDQ